MSESNTENNETSYPIHKLHCLDGKHFVVIDKSLIERLGMVNDSELYFQQELTQDNSIELRIFRFKSIS